MSNPAFVKYSIGDGVPGSYDNIKLLPGGNSSWRKMPNNVPEQKCKKYFVAQGTPLPLKHEMQFMSPVKDSMFMFGQNISSPACCPATFSTDHGCVCTTKQQRDYIGVNRGGNVNYPNDGF